MSITEMYSSIKHSLRRSSLRTLPDNLVVVGDTASIWKKKKLVGVRIQVVAVFSVEKLYLAITTLEGTKNDMLY